MKMISEKAECSCTHTCEVSWEAYQRQSKRIEDTNKKIRLLVRILVDKKLIGPELAKTFEETASSSKDILAWYLDLEKKNSKKE